MQDFLTLYVIAMDSEAKDLLFGFKLINEIPKIYKKDNELILITGVGKTNASFALTYVLAKYNIKKVINLGFVGAFGNFEIGDKVFVKEAKYHDFDLTIFGYEKGQVPKLPVLYKPSLINKNNYKESLLLTGDYFQTNPVDENFISDMEGAALFQVSYLLNVPIVSFKVVSDVIGRDNHIDEYNSFEAKGSTYILDIYNEIKGDLID